MPADAAVIDASVALKWVLPELGAAAAARLYDALVDAGAAVYVPDLFWSETSNALWRLARGPDGPLSPAEARDLFAVLRLAPVTTQPVEPLADRALAVALATDLTAYDAAYVALGEAVEATVCTADAVLVGKLAGTEWEERVTLLE